MTSQRRGRYPSKPRPRLEKLMEESRKREITEEELEQQCISFVYGNAPVDLNITREAAEAAVRSMWPANYKPRKS